MTADTPRGVTSTLRDWLQPEDLALAGLMLLAPLLGGGADERSIADALLDGGHDPAVGSIALLATVGAIVAMATRVPGESRVDE